MGSRALLLKNARRGAAGGPFGMTGTSPATPGIRITIATSFGSSARLSHKHVSPPKWSSW